MAKKKVDTKQIMKKTEESQKVNITEPKIRQENVPKLPDTYDMFATKKGRGFVAMTEQASTRADETAKDRRATGNPNNINAIVSPRLGNCIHKIREDK
jgi:hypothetical protein